MGCCEFWFHDRSEEEKARCLVPRLVNQQPENGTIWHIFRLQAATATAFQDSSSDLINRYHFQFGHITIPDRPPRTGSSRHTCNRFAPSKSFAEKFRGQDWRIAAIPAADSHLPDSLRRGSCGAGAGGSTPSARHEGSAPPRSHFKRHMAHLYYIGHPNHQ